MTFTLRSTAFNQDALIPGRYTCDGGDISPELSWTDSPKGTQSFVLIMDDPDAPMGTWDHWLLFNIPPETSSLKEAIEILPPGTKVGKNSWERSDYGGPCPPDKEHRYFFWLYALSGALELSDGATKTEIQAAMEGLILGSTELMGRYNRPSNS